MQVEVAVKRLDLRQDVSELMTLKSAQLGNFEDRQAVVGYA